MPLDWDKLRVFHAAAEAGSFTHAGETLHMSQSAVSRQVSALEHEVGVALFNRHARGLVLTEQGEHLFRAANEVFVKLETVRAQLSESTERPSGQLRVTTTVGLGSGWLTYRVQDFLELFPEIQLHLMLSNEELDLNMRQADCAIRLRAPSQPDLIQRKLFTVHFHVYASPSYLNKYGRPEKPEDLDNHRIIGFAEPAPAYLMEMRSFLTLGRPDGTPRVPVLDINSIMSIKRAVQRGIGIAMLPDYAVEKDAGLVQLLGNVALPSFDTYFVYPEALRNSAKLQAFRDFLISKARSWEF
ncbi:LysR family transcriptional regulator [Oricola indica]|jgi:DNA-binding transcriptional LysR family regulator|uniref:LysR family transcriptional regulator n=1 Tax=Oricola indica TaxID=2872591 RepID=UPI001CBE73EC|nr:LysR family transcriptional regulator [Oricola indica]